MTTKIITYITQHWPEKEPYDGWVVVNLYPFVDPRSARLREKRREQCGESAWRSDMEVNLEDIRKEGKVATKRVVAYGGGETSKAAKRVVADSLRAFGGPTWCLGQSEKGPSHPGQQGKVKPLEQFARLVEPFTGFII
jgi:hypothetical protein